MRHSTRLRCVICRQLLGCWRRLRRHQMYAVLRRRDQLRKLLCSGSSGHTFSDWRGLGRCADSVTIVSCAQRHIELGVLLHPASNDTLTAMQVDFLCHELQGLPP